MPVKVNVEVKGVQQAIGKLKAYQVSKRLSIRQIVMETAVRVESGAISRAPVDKGNLKRSMGRKIHQGGMAAEVYNTAEYAPHVEFGTRAHEIRPKKGKLLSWIKGGKRIFARRVRHPGTKAQPFLFPAWESQRPGFLSRIRQELRKPR